MIAKFHAGFLWLKLLSKFDREAKGDNFSIQFHPKSLPETRGIVILL